MRTMGRIALVGLFVGAAAWSMPTMAGTTKRCCLTALEDRSFIEDALKPGCPLAVNYLPEVAAPAKPARDAAPGADRQESVRERLPFEKGSQPAPFAVRMRRA